jgi:hypothetical protein
VREIWRYDGKTLRFLVLTSNHTYRECDYSSQFPFLRPADLLPYLRIDDARDETARLRSFVDWLRQQTPHNERHETGR